MFDICDMECCGQCFIVTNTIAISCFASQSDTLSPSRAMMRAPTNWGAVIRGYKGHDTIFGGVTKKGKLSLRKELITL